MTTPTMSSPTISHPSSTHGRWAARLAIMVGASLAMLIASPAQARPDVHWSISIGAPVYVEPAPAAYYYVPPPPPRPVYVQPAPIVYGPPGYYYEPRPYPRHHRHHHHHHRHGYRDSDRDGVPDRYDRRPENPWRQ